MAKECIKIKVKGKPPYYDKGFSIRNTKHPRWGLTKNLLMQVKDNQKSFDKNIPLSIHVVVKRPRKGKADSMNILTAIADILQEKWNKTLIEGIRKHKPIYRPVYYDDNQIKNVTYIEKETKNETSYIITIKPI